MYIASYVCKDITSYVELAWLRLQSMFPTSQAVGSFGIIVFIIVVVGGLPLKTSFIVAMQHV